jgi:hypothetical protein
MKLALILLVDGLLASLAPIVTLFYRGGWFNTPDDPVSPRGMGEPFMRKLHAHLPAWVADYWWLGWRNKAYGWSYANKPAVFKGLRYDLVTDWQGFNVIVDDGWLSHREIHMLGYSEHTFTLTVKGKPRLGLIVGYRLRPIWDELCRNLDTDVWDVPHRPINMDARPILSIRFGGDD